MNQIQTHLLVRKYNFKMNILVKVLVITIASTLLVLMLFDYETSLIRLNLTSKINCIDIRSPSHRYLCNTCFKVTPKGKVNQNLKIQSDHPFLLVSLHQKISGILTCEEWLQTVDYETLPTGNPQEDKLILRFQPTVARFIKQLEKQHNQILLIQKPKVHLQKTQDLYKVESKLDLPYQVISYYSDTTDNPQIKIFQRNETIKSNGIHAITLLTISAGIAIIILFHFIEKGSVFKKYREHIFSVIGIFGTLCWIIFGNLFEQYSVFLIFLKVLFFSMSLNVVFGAGKFLFFGIVFISNFLIASVTSFQNTLIIEVALLSIISMKVVSESQKQYFWLGPNSNKKVYLLIMTFFIIACSGAQYFWQNETFGQVLSFLVSYFCMLGLLIGMKNLDGQNYEEYASRQMRQIQPNETEIFEASSTTMYDQSSRPEPRQLKEIKQ